LEFNVPFQHKYGYIRDELQMRHSKIIRRLRFAMTNDSRKF